MAAAGFNRDNYDMKVNWNKSSRMAVFAKYSGDSALSLRNSHAVRERGRPRSIARTPRELLWRTWGAATLLWSTRPGLLNSSGS
jgi:hypothetical protein